MLTAWQWGVLLFLATGWMISEAFIAWSRQREVEEVRRIVDDYYREAITRMRAKER